MNYSFRPPARAVLLFGLFFPLFLALGFWQLQRAQQRDAINELRESRRGEDPIRLDRLPADDARDLRYRPVVLEGEYDAAHQFLVDNQSLDRAVGYHVLTPFRLDGGDAVLVNRGWVPVGADRARLPDVSRPPGGRIRLSGVIDRFHRVGYRLRDADIPGPGWPSVVQVPEPARLAARLGYPARPYQVLLNPDQVGGYRREWLVARLDSGKNRGYALQWFLFAALALILFVRRGLNNPQRESTRS